MAFDIKFGQTFAERRVGRGSGYLAGFVVRLWFGSGWRSGGRNCFGGVGCKESIELGVLFAEGGIGSGAGVVAVLLDEDGGVISGHRVENQFFKQCLFFWVGVAVVLHKGVKSVFGGWGIGGIGVRVETGKPCAFGVNELEESAGIGGVEGDARHEHLLARVVGGREL